MASRRPRTADAGPPERRDRWRRYLLAGQGLYYLLTGLWPLLHFDSFARAVALPLNPFQAQAFGAVMAVIGASLAEAARKEPPGVYPTVLGIAVAGAIALVSLIWLPRTAGVGVLWLDLVLEVAIAIALLVTYPRIRPERSRATRRR